MVLINLAKNMQNLEALMLNDFLLIGRNLEKRPDQKEIC